MVSALFSVIMRLNGLLVGHSTWHKKGIKVSGSLHHTPPVPNLHSYSYAIYFGGVGSSWKREVGYFVQVANKHMPIY